MKAYKVNLQQFCAYLDEQRADITENPAKTLNIQQHKQDESFQIVEMATSNV